MSSDEIHYIDHAIIKTCKLTNTVDNGTTTGADQGVLAVNSDGKITRIPGGSDGQLLTRSTANVNGVTWQSSSASSAPQYTLLSSGTIGHMSSDPGAYTGSISIAGTLDVVAINIGSVANFSNNLSTTSVSYGHRIVFTIVKMTSGGRYRLYSTTTVFNGSGSTPGGNGYFEMDSVGQGVQLVYTEYGWAVIGGGGAVLGTI